MADRKDVLRITKGKPKPEASKKYLVRLDTEVYAELSELAWRAHKSMTLLASELLSFAMARVEIVENIENDNR